MRNARVARSFDLSGKRVLDVGCGLGVYTLCMADSAKEVVGIDHQQARIQIAEDRRQSLGYSNVRFKIADIRDPGFVEEMGSFDLVTAWGFLHRVPDLFSLLYSLSRIANSLSFEWQTPVFPFMKRASVAFHLPGAEVLDPTNLAPVGSLTPEEVSEQKIQGRSGYWLPTPFAVESILRRCGYKSARILGYGEELWPERGLILRRLARGAVRGYERVHMIVERDPGSISFKHKDFRDAGLPEWAL